MNTLICTLNSKYIHSSLAPWCLFSACKTYCCDDIVFEVFEGTVNKSTSQMLNHIISKNPDLVTFSCYIWNKMKTLELCREIKRIKPDTIIILGGPEAAYNQRELLESFDFVDFVLSGEGEIVLPSLINELKKGSYSENLPGVSCQTNGDFIIKKEVIGENFDYPSPYCEEYFASLGGRIAYIESSRGCPFNCSYCLSGRCGKVKFKDLEQTKKEILLLASSGTKTVKFIDRTFNCDNSRAVEILRFIRKNYGRAIPEGVCFHFEISADILKDSFTEEVSLARKGSLQFEIGIQSMNEETLRAIGRKCDRDRLSENIRKLTLLRNCHIHTDLIAGLPFETPESFEDAFNKSYALNADMLQLGFLKLLHGSALREESNLYPCEFSPLPPYEVISTPTMTKTDLTVLKAVEKELDRLHNSGRFRRTLSYVFESTGLSPFELFHFLGIELEKILPGNSAPLDRYTDALFDVLVNLQGINALSLRDRMIYDRIATNNSGILPKCLYLADSRLKAVKHTLAEAYPLKKGTNRSVAILYSEKKVIFCDYEKKDSVTGEYSVKEESFSFFDKTFFDFDIDK